MISHQTSNDFAITCNDSRILGNDFAMICNDSPMNCNDFHPVLPASGPLLVKQKPLLYQRLRRFERNSKGNVAMIFRQISNDFGNDFAHRPKPSERSLTGGGSE